MPAFPAYFDARFAINYRGMTLATFCGPPQVFKRFSSGLFDYSALMVEIVEVNDIDELSQFRMLWKSLFVSTPNATFFLTFDWLDTYWRHFGYEHKLRVLVVFAAGEPVGILPLCVRTESNKLSRVRVLTYPLDDWSTWYGPIGPNPASTMLAAMQHIRRTPRDWDMMELRWVPDDGTQGGKTARAMRIAGMFSEKRMFQTTSLVDIENDGVGSHFRARGIENPNLKSKMRSDPISVNYIRHRPLAASEGDGDPNWELFAMCECISQTNGQQQDQRVNEFFRATHEVAARLGMLDMNVLKIEGRPAAFSYGYHFQGKVTIARTGFDTSIDNDPESAIMLQLIEDSRNRGDDSIDFGPGEREYKRHLRSRTESTYRLTYTPLDSWRSQAVRITRWAKRRWRTRQSLSTAAG
jgi:CelD/BcsL family acetyltransferase involved in cellulose biosynthesis